MTIDDLTLDAAATAVAIGRLVLVVGPSGAGKDTLIDAARDALAEDPGFAFPRRIVTRPPSSAENNVFAETTAFREARARGAFALAWEAHGHGYGIPAAIEAHLAAGIDVVANVSRTVVEEARRRWPSVVVIEITAPAEVLAQRIALRGRTSDDASSDRLARRLPTFSSDLADVSIDNGSDLEAAITAFVAALRRPQDTRTS